MTEMTTKQFADALSTDPKTLRKFLRDTTPRESHPGKGGRWVLPGTKSAISAARKGFAKWNAEQADAAKERAAAIAKSAQDALAAIEGSDEDSDAPDATPDES